MKKAYVNNRKGEYQLNNSTDSGYSVGRQFGCATKNQMTNGIWFLILINQRSCPQDKYHRKSTCKNKSLSDTL